MKKLFYPIFSNIEILKGKDTQRVLYTKTKVFARVTFCALQGKYPLTLFRHFYLRITAIKDGHIS